MTSMCHDYVSGTPTTSMASWSRKLFPTTTSFILVSPFGVVMLFSLVYSNKMEYNKKAWWCIRYRVLMGKK